jgi:pimeloyl-ACP methyl ester carboxylesterase
MDATNERIALRVYGDAALPTLIYLPGLHGDWTLVSSFRAAVKGKARFVEFTYPRTVSWSLEDYARAVIQELKANSIHSGWLLGESFSSQIAWKIIDLTTAEPDLGFEGLGLILAGGFARYPILTGVRFVRVVNRMMPASLMRFGLSVYASYARLRHRRAPETRANINEFIARRTETDRQAILHRYGLILSSDAMEAACRCRLPIYALAGFVDPVVPWLWTLPWLRRHRPGFRDWRIILNADHNVLGTAPRKAAEQILRWMSAP